MKTVAVSNQRDALSEVLLSARFRGTVLCRTEFTAPWGFAIVGREFATFHIVIRGRCCLEVEDVEGQMWLSEGDLVILPHGSRHVVRDQPSSPATSLEELIAAGDFSHGTLRFGGGGELAILVCGGFFFEDAGLNPVRSSLPLVVRLSGDNHGVDRWFQAIMDFLADEIAASRPGADSVVTRLAEILFVEAVRAYFSSPQAAEAKLSVALEDPRVGAAVALIHREPERQWDLAMLANQVGMSRTAFAVRFKELVGISPLRYIAQRRMSKAAHLLQFSKLTILDVAQRVGYDSDIAFSRAFKRHAGQTPAAFREQSRAAVVRPSAPTPR